MRKKIIFLMVVFLSLIQTSCSQNSVVQLEPSPQGIYLVPVTINGIFVIKFYLDTGANEGSISPLAIEAMKQKGCVIQELEPRSFILADGRTILKRRVIIEEVIVGDYALENVPMTVNDQPGLPMLLGHNVLSGLGVIEINYITHTLTIK